MSEGVPISCLVQAKGRGWTLRRRVPDDIRGIIGKGEVWRSLRAKSYAEARRLLPLENAKIEAAFAEARRRLAESVQPTQPAPVALPEPTEAVLRQAVLHWFHQQDRVAVAEDRQIAACGDPDAVVQELLTDRSHLMGDDGRIQAAKLAREVLGTYGFAPPNGQLRDLAVDLLQAALVEGVRRSQERLGDRAGAGDPDRLFKDVLGLGEAPPPPQAPDAPATTQEDLPPLKAEDLLNVWAAERKPSAATRRKYGTTFAHVARILGFDDVRSITPDDVVKFKRVRLETEKRDTGTVEDDIRNAGAVCKWAMTNRMLTGNPFAGLAPKSGRRGPAPRAPYDDDEAARILTAARAETGWLRWGPWLLCFTGARINELAELRRGDVRREGDVWFLDIVPTNARVGKNATMQRMIPLHPAVLAEGFLDYVTALPAGPLFPSIKPDPRGGRVIPATTTIGRWMRGKVKITDERKAPSHSWRHRMQDELRKVRALPEVMDALTGRHNPRNAGDGYGVGFRGMPDEVLKDLARVPCPLTT